MQINIILLKENARRNDSSIMDKSTEKLYILKIDREISFKNNLPEMNLLLKNNEIKVQV